MVKMKAKTPVRKTIEDEQFDKDGNVVCPTCKKSAKRFTDLSFRFVDCSGQTYN